MRPPMTNRLDQPRHHWWHRLKLSTQKFAAILTITAVVSGFAYVFMTNSTANNGFAIKNMQRQVDELMAANEKMELRAADLRSLAAIERNSVAFNLETTEKYEYLPTSGGAVALGR